MLRAYCRIMGAVFASWAIAALLLLGVWGQDPFRIVLFLGSSFIFLYAGFGRVKARELRVIVGGMGILYLVSASFLIVLWAWMSTPQGEPEMPKILLRGTIGIVSLLCARFLPQREAERNRTPEGTLKGLASVAKEAALAKDHATAAPSLPKEDLHQDSYEGRQYDQEHNEYRDHFRASERVGQ